MIGQGRPSLLAAACALGVRGRVRRAHFGRRIALVLALCGFVASECAAQAPPVSDPVRLRITWGGGDASRWFGRFSVDQGSVSNLKLLGTAADAAGSIWLENGEVRVVTLSARERDAIEIIVAAGQNAKLLIELSNDAVPTRSHAQVPLSDLSKQPYVQRLDDRENTLKVELLPNDALRIVADREPMIFAPGEQFAFELSAELADMAPGTTLDIHTTLSPARGNEALWSDEQRMEVPVEGHPRIRLNVPLPVAEGAYKIRLSAMRPPGFRERFFPSAQAPLAERSFEIVVLDPRPQSGDPRAEWETVLEIDPTNARWWDRLPSWTQLRRIPGLNRGPLGSIRAGAVELPLGRFVELPPTVAGMDPHWQAYSLPLEAAGTPHVLEIDYPADEEQHFGVSIVEPNAAGLVEGTGRDSGVYVEGMDRGDAKGTYRMVFWPRTQAPLLLMANAHPTAAAHFGHIRVLKLRGGRLADGLSAPPHADRLVAAYVARPLVPEAFGASGGIEPSSRGAAVGSVDDWQTFYESATRLAEYVRYGGYNSAVVSVLADGSTIYPSSKLASTPLHNTGRGAANANEPDALELMLRVFDREGLALVPAVQLATPIPELEALRRGSDPHTSGLEWVGPDGRTWLATRGTTDGLAPYYNLLAPRVQQAVIDVVRELVTRCEKHPSFAGVAVQLSARGFAQLPPLEWGLDDATVGRFERDTGIQLAAAGPERFAARHALLTGEHAAAWRAWRAARWTEFYAQLATMLRETGDGRKLLITLEEVCADPHIAARIRPDVMGENRVAATFLDLGIDRVSLEAVPGVVVCPTRYVESLFPLTDRGVDLELNQATASWHRESGSAGTRAALLYHRAQRRRLASFEAKSPLRVAGGMTLVPQPLAHSTAVRQPYVQSLLDNDPAVLLDGGELPPFGQEDMLRQVRSIVCQLPTSAEVAEHIGQPVFVRTYSEANRTTVLIVNACPWHAEVEVMLDVSQPTTLEPISAVENDSASGRPQVRMLAAGTQPWLLSLEPYAVEAVRIEAPGVKIANVRAELSDAGKAELTRRVAELANRDFTAPRVYSVLTNPSFEPVSGAGPVPGWRVMGSGATAELDATSPQDGKTCLYFQSVGPVATLASEDFATPPTGQLAMTVFARGQNIDPRTQLRMIFEAEHEGQAYRRSFIVGGAPAGAQRLEAHWRPYAILVNDLPFDSQGRMRVRFELSGPGEVWLDQVKLYELLFPLKFYQYGQAEIKQFLILIHAAQRAVEAGRVADAVRLLEGYWPRFITAYTPMVQPPIAVQPVELAPKMESESAPPADQDQEPASSIGERIKRMVPFVR